MKHLIFLFTISLLSCQNKKSENRERFNKPTINQTEKKDLEGKSDTIHYSTLISLDHNSYFLNCFLCC